MKNLLYAIMILSCFTSIYPYAFVHGSKSVVDKVVILVRLPGSGWGAPSAEHRDVKRGNKGRGAEWNWQAIEKQSKGKVKKGDAIDFRIQVPYEDNAWFSYVAYEGKIRSDGIFGFIVERLKNPTTNRTYTVIPNDQEAINEYVPADTVSVPASSVPATRIKCYILRATYGSGSKQADVTAILTNLTNTKLTKNESFNFSGGNGSFNQLFGDPSVGEAKQLFIEFKDEKGMVKTKTIQEDQPFTLP